MEYEIDFLPVGDASKGGDAICFRCWSPGIRPFVAVIDGGTVASGSAIVEFVQQHYGTDVVDLVINTHPHADHAAGLYEVIEKLNVKRLMMHLPWEHASELKDLFHDGRITSDSIDRRVRDALNHAHELYEIAVKKGVPIVEPFVGADTGCPYFKILSPTVEYYRELLVDFTSTPEKASAAHFAEAIKIGAERLIKWVREHWDHESLVTPVRGTNSENNSSVVTLVDFGSERLLFTGDAGVPALEVACKVAEWNSIPLQDFSFVQIPHHGSKRNVSPDILNRLIGHPSPAGTKQFRAMASVPATGEPKHPSRRVLNAFKRRGADVFLTQGKGVCLKSKQAPPRAGWVTVTAQPFFEEVESDESD